jgi:hypothetical protein
MILTRFIGVFGRTSFALFMALYLAHLELNGSSFTEVSDTLLSSVKKLCTETKKPGNGVDRRGDVHARRILKHIIKRVFLQVGELANSGMILTRFIGVFGSICSPS